VLHPDMSTTAAIGNNLCSCAFILQTPASYT
jgi:hypothetical protein